MQFGGLLLLGGERQIIPLYASTCDLELCVAYTVPQFPYL